MLCCAVLCCVVLCCAVLCCVVPFCVVLCSAVLYCVVLCCVVLCFVVLCCVVLCCVVLCCVVLCFVVLCCIVPCCVVLQPSDGDKLAGFMHYYTNILTTFDDTAVENVYAAGLKQESSMIKKGSETQTSPERRGTSFRVSISSERYFLTRFHVSAALSVRSAGLRCVKSATIPGFRHFLIWHRDRV